MKNVPLSDYQILMLQLSDKDIKDGKLIPHEELDKEDSLLIDELDRRLHDYQNGIGKTYTWEETVALINQKLEKGKS